MIISEHFSNEDIWKGIILSDSNAATDKMALAKSLQEFSSQNITTVTWDDLAESFLNQYIERLETNQMPQQSNPNRLTVMERVVRELHLGKITRTDAIDIVVKGNIIKARKIIKSISQARQVYTS